ncbi:MAG: hypothetical protein IH889_05510, partial [Planctomycetes bacterium]|nr:hypothetical protein [Planctomycetota bacterium]
MRHVADAGLPRPTTSPLFCLPIALGLALAIACHGVSAQPCEPYWSDDFPSADLAVGLVFALTSFDDGSGDGAALYIGGHLPTAGEVAINNIAKFEGNSWSPLGSGLNSGVWALTGFDDGSGSGLALFAGGAFSWAGDVSVNSIAKWDGETWSPLGSGMVGPVTALAVFDDGLGGGPALYAGGNFITAGGVRANSIAKWDGDSWSPLVKGIDGIVYAMTVFDDGSGSGPALYVGGHFTTAGGAIVNDIAKWDGLTWSPVASGIDGGSLWALAVFDDGNGAALYAGGSFTSAGGVSANNIARWDGSTWSPVGGGTDNGVLVLAAFDNTPGSGPALYAGGDFSTAGGVTAYHVAKWDGSSWSPLGGGLDRSVRVLAVLDDASEDAGLYAGGFFWKTGDQVSAVHFAKWDGTDWAGVGGGLSGWVTALISTDLGSNGRPDLYVGGFFTRAGNIAAGSIAKWDGQTWSRLGSGVEKNAGAGSVRTLAVL